jgi:archaeal flagellar protein FlaJ
LDGGVTGPRTSLYAKLVAKRSGRFADLLRRSGRVGNPAAMAGDSVRLAVRVSFLAIPVAALGALFVTPWAAFACAAPLVPLLAPEVRLRDEVAQRREGVERELPFFSLLVSVLAGAGTPLYSVLKDLASGDVFASLRREALLVRRDVEVFGMNPDESLERLASRHPSSKFSSFLLGYTSKSRSGGDISVYLTGESGAFLRELEEGWARYVARVGIVGSMMITVFGVVPLLLMVVGVFSPAFSVVGLAFFTGVGVPVFTMGLLYMTGRMQPAPEEPPRGRALRCMAISLPFALPGLLLKLPWASVAPALFVFFVTYGLSVRGQLSEVRAFDEGLSRFLKDLLEYKRLDYDLSRAVASMSAQGGYGRPFELALAKVAAKLRAGVPLDEVRIGCRSSLGRLSFLLLGEMSRSGGGSVDTVFQVSTFADRMISMKKNAAAEMKPYLILSYLSPLLLAFGVTFVSDVLTSFRSRVGPTLAGVHIGAFQAGAIPPGLSQVSDLLIVVSAASLGLIGAKITDLTVRNTLRASVNVGLAVAALVAMAALASHSFPGLPRL